MKLYFSNEWRGWKFLLDVPIIQISISKKNYIFFGLLGFAIVIQKERNVHLIHR